MKRSAADAWEQFPATRAPGNEDTGIPIVVFNAVASSSTSGPRNHLVAEAIAGVAESAAATI